MTNDFMAIETGAEVWSLKYSEVVEMVVPAEVEQ